MKQVGVVKWSAKIFIALLCVTKCFNEVQGQYGQNAGAWQFSFEEGATELLLTISQLTQYVNVTIFDVDLSTGNDFHFEVNSDNPKWVHVEKRIERAEFAGNPASWQGEVPVLTRHFGFTHLYVTLHPSNGDAVERSPGDVTLTVARKERLDEKIFSYTASVLLLLMFLNLGGVLNLERLKAIVLRPVTVSIGFCTSYILMPALALALGYLFLPKQKELQLALFFTALSPSGGLANICCLFLKGNVNLSIATTTINSLMSLAMFPLWIVILTHTMFRHTELAVPFADLAIGAVALICAIGLGMLLRFLLPKTTNLIFRFLKPFCACLSLALIGMTIGINAFAFKLLTIWIFLATVFLPIIGYTLAFGISKLLRCSATDALTISIETSVLNMTVPIVLLQRTFDEVRADMSLIVPITAALLSLIMMLVIYAIRRFFGWNNNVDDDAFESKVELVDNVSSEFKDSSPVTTIKVAHLNTLN
ncbi:PREDICTED: solute carrier family 10 member 6 [Rhagoletis zephyria]|uniref:solute carrier family 10 member 6 n=1 Tax=Rhagoletis zephyria TaxID=28612 RepID=UPI00081176FC|nr:PREDICTED: solute carrier family 10 member 6 [Rhagoletis zephyria]